MSRISYETALELSSLEDLKIVYNRTNIRVSIRHHRAWKGIELLDGATGDRQR